MMIIKDIIAKNIIVKKFWFIPVFIWFVIVAVSLLWSLLTLNAHLLQIARAKAEAMFSFIQTTRFWNAKHGGVYVPVTPETKPNPYLNVPDRDITSIDGKMYTKVNPAYMTRQIADIAIKNRDIIFNITSLNPIRPENKADMWETLTLKEFAQKDIARPGTRDDTVFTKIDYINDSEGKRFRYMAVLKVEKPCLKCHDNQGYKLGEVRGGISITIPALPIFESARFQKYNLITLHIVVFIIVTTLMVYVMAKLRKHWLTLNHLNQEQELIIEKRTAQLKDSNNQLLDEIRIRKNTEKILRESETRLRSITQTAIEAIITADSDGTIISWNNAAENAFGYTKDEVVGKDITILMPERFRQRHTEAIRKFLTTRNNILIGKTVEMYGLKKDHIEFPIEISLSSWKTREGEFFTGIIRDASERKKMETEIQELNKGLEKRVAEETESRRQKEQMLIQQSKMASMGEMIGAIAHQWRQPLNALGIIIQDIEDAYEFDELDEQYIKKTVDDSLTQIQFMSKTIDDFRNFFKTSKQIKPFDVAEGINEVLSILSAQFRHNYINVQIEKKDNHSFIISGYSNELVQVVLNILNNAKDAILERRIEDGDSSLEGQILIRLVKIDESTSIEIIDNGGGVPEEIKDKIFEPYFTHKKDGTGTGIGLYMSKVIVENNMGGKLYFENVDMGAKFVIDFS